ncbi:MAG: 2-oxoglutarate and iron-dependent oxygenase domain-containing protein [Pseudomonadota bacterium]
MAEPVLKNDADRMIPVIDIGPLRDGSDPVGVARQLQRASREVGFIYVANHGIPEQDIEAARDMAMRFFHQPAEHKMTVAVSGAHRGFLSVGGAKMQDDAKADLKESFVWGYESREGKTPDDHPLRGDNRWPATLPQMQSVSMDYFHKAHGVADHLMRGFALGLDLPEDTFLKTNDAPISRASYVYYPPQESDTGDQFGVGPHTDFGVLTVLCQDSVGGLQVETLDGEWIAAPPIAGTLVVNVGDLLSRWTNGLYRSTPHRVINTSGKERLSLVLAYDPEPRTMIDARDVLGDDIEPNEPPITCGDYLTWRFGKAFSHLAKDND